MMASEPFVFHGRSLCVWDHFQATPAEAAELTRTRYAVVRQKRYQTADIAAETVTEPYRPTIGEDIPVDGESDRSRSGVRTDTAAKKRRRYKRRDLTSEPS